MTIRELDVLQTDWIQNKHSRFVVLLVLVVLLIVGAWLFPEFAMLEIAIVGIGIPFLFFMWVRPEFGLLVLLFLTSSFVPADIVDLRLPVGGLDLRDLVLLGMFGVLFAREIARKTLCIPWGRVGLLLFLFLVMALLSAFTAMFFQNVEHHWVLSDLRILCSYVVFFMVIWGIRKYDQLNVLLIGLFILVDLTTTIVILQQFSGVDAPLLEAMLTTRDWQVDQVVGAVRVIPAGQVLMHFMWFIAVGILFYARPSLHARFFYIFQIIYIGVGHILSYMRAQWVSILIGAFLLGLLLLPRYWKTILKYLIPAVYALLIVVLGVVNFSRVDPYQIPFIVGIMDRFTSILSPASTLQSSSLQWREFENKKALEAIRKQPWIGVGLGGQYRELTTFQGESMGLWTRGSMAADQVTRFTRYVHNSYLSIAVKMGIPGLFVLIWCLVEFFLNGWKIYWTLPTSDLKGIVLGILAGFAGMFFWCFFHAHLIKAESTPVLGLMMGLVAVTGNLHKLGVGSKTKGIHPSRVPFRVTAREAKQI